MGPDALSKTFADNVGSDDTVVHSGELTLSSSVTGPASGPKDFDIVIALSTSFFYDPAAGDLLLDVRNFGGGLTTQFDAASSVGDSISRVNDQSPDGVNDLIGSTDSTALITQFTITPIPEPSTLALFALGLGGVAWWRRRSKRSTQV